MTLLASRGRAQAQLGMEGSRGFRAQVLAPILSCLSSQGNWDLHRGGRFVSVKVCEISHWQQPGPFLRLFVSLWVHLWVRVWACETPSHCAWLLECVHMHIV